jgi:hypothetical protein
MFLSTTCKVLYSFDEVKNNDWSNVFHFPTAYQRVMVAIDGIDIGIIILNNMVSSLAPSINADSSISAGICMKKFLKMSKLQVEIAPGIR